MHKPAEYDRRGLLKVKRRVTAPGENNQFLLGQTTHFNQLNELTDEEKSQLTDKQKKTLKALIGSAKPSVPFSSATLYDCVRPDGLALNIDYTRVKAPTIHIPVDFPAPAASAHLCETLARIEKVWVLDNEKACRLVIDAILTEVLLNESNEQLLGFCEVKNDWEGTGFGYTGDVDYMFGSSETKSVDTMDSFLLVVEAKKEWPDSAISQVIAETSCLLKKRLSGRWKEYSCICCSYQWTSLSLL